MTHTLDKYALETAAQSMITCYKLNLIDEGGRFVSDFHRLAYAAITSYLSDVQPQSGWLPIESAPINTFVLACSDSTSRIVLKDDLGNWRYRHGGPISNKPTHWMPLPAPPKSDNKEE